jgi:hypothetical protein
VASTPYEEKTMTEMTPEMSEMAAADNNLGDAIMRSISTDIGTPDLRGWVALAVHVQPDDQVAVWWNVWMLDDQQFASLLRATLEELEGGGTDGALRQEDAAG